MGGKGASAPTFVGVQLLGKVDARVGCCHCSRESAEGAVWRLSGGNGHLFTSLSTEIQTRAPPSLVLEGMEWHTSSSQRGGTRLSRHPPPPPLPQMPEWLLLVAEMCARLLSPEQSGQARRTGQVPHKSIFSSDQSLLEKVDVMGHSSKSSFFKMALACLTPPVTCSGHPTVHMFLGLSPPSSPRSKAWATSLCTRALLGLCTNTEVLGG